MKTEEVIARRMAELGDMPAGSWELAEELDAFLLEYSSGRNVAMLILSPNHETDGKAITVAITSDPAPSGRAVVLADQQNLLPSEALRAAINQAIANEEEDE